MRKKYQYLFILLLIISNSCHSAIFCVTTSNELQTALSEADSNGQSDIIKIAEGNYPTSSTNPGFIYSGSENTDIEISGGWIFFFGNPCGQKGSGNPFNTVLDGNLTHRVLKLVVGTQTVLKISNILFVNGDATNSRGGGIFTAVAVGATNDGEVYIENNAFLNNTATTGSAFSTSGQILNGANNKIVIKNNLFTINHSVGNIGSSTVSISQSNTIGTYFINNTLVLNTVEMLSGTSTSGLYLNVSGTSQALIANNIFRNDIRSEFYLTGSGTKYLYNNDIAMLGHPLYFT